MMTKQELNDLIFKFDRLMLLKLAQKIEVKDMPVDEELILSGLIVNSRKNKGKS